MNDDKNYYNLRNLILNKDYDVFFKELNNNKAYYSKDNQKINLYYYVHTSQDENVINKFMDMMVISDIDNLRIKNLKRYLIENNKVINSKLLYEEISLEKMLELSYQEIKVIINSNENEIYNLYEKYPLLVYKNIKFIINDLFVNRKQSIYKVFDLNENKIESISHIINSLVVNINNLYSSFLDNKGNFQYERNEQFDKQNNFFIEIISDKNIEETTIKLLNKHLIEINKTKKNNKKLIIDTIGFLIPNIEYKYYEKITNNKNSNIKNDKKSLIKI